MKKDDDNDDDDDDDEDEDEKVKRKKKNKEWRERRSTSNSQVSLWAVKTPLKQQILIFQLSQLLFIPQICIT